MSTTTTTTRDRGDRYGPIEWAQQLGTKYPWTYGYLLQCCAIRTSVLVGFGVVMVAGRRAGPAADDAVETGRMRLLGAQLHRVTVRAPLNEQLPAFLRVAFRYAHRCGFDRHTTLQPEQNNTLD